MKQLLLLICIACSFGAFAQTNMEKAIVGEWVLTHYKSSPIEFSEKQSSLSSIQNDSLIILIVSTDSITIIKKTIIKKDTTTLKYKIVTPSGQNIERVLPSLVFETENIEQFKKKYRDSFEKTETNIVKLTNSQLVLESFSVDNNIPSPFYRYSYNTYFFSKVTQTKTSELDFIGDWFLCDTSNIKMNSDTLFLTKDTCSFYFPHMNLPMQEKLNFVCSFQQNLGQTDYCELVMKYEIGEVIQGSNYNFKGSWVLNSVTNVITFKDNTQSYNYSYKFISPTKLLLIKK